MATFLSFNQLVLNYINYLRLAQPNMSTVPGSVSRDLIVNVNSQQLATLYSQLQNVYGLQSLFSASGTDLDNLATNYNLVRNQGTDATGVAVFTTNNLTSDILIPQGTVVTANNGTTYQTQSSASMLASNSNVYKATAARLATQLALAGITDQYAIQVTVEALTPGTAGNIDVYSLTAQNVSGIAHITNTTAFSGGTDQETDNQFVSRILSIFAGSNTGTALGYTTTLESINGITSVVVVGPGDPLMTRDGTIVTTNSSGQLVITSEGTGGKVDLYVLGSLLAAQIDTYVYIDQSGDNDPTNPLNNFILGQNGQSTTLNTQQRRVQLIASGVLPEQPVNNIISVSGSMSGNNFVAQYTASDGTTQGNYVLQKDTGSYAGSPFGYDQLHWISNQIRLSGELDVKGIFNGSDALTYSDVQEISAINQNVSVTNENSAVNPTNRASLTLKHTPISTVSRVVDLTTGERYTVANQNPNGTAGQLNTSGVITISGSTLPVVTDVLQVDYTWVKPFDPVFDFDNLSDYNRLRSVQDSVDWSFGNTIQLEPCVVAIDAYGNTTVTTTDNISRVIDILTYTTQTSVVSSGAVVVSNIVNNVLSIRRLSDNAELYNTDLRNGTISGSSILLPTDSLGINGDSVNVQYNTINEFVINNVSGTFTNNIITFPNGTGLVAGTIVYVDYVANVSTLLSTTNLSNLPAVQLENTLTLNGTVAGEQPTTNIYAQNGITFVQNLRRAATTLQVDCENIGGNGIISVSGTSFNKVTSAFVTVLPGDGYTIDLTQAIATDLGVSVLNIPSTVSVAKLYSVKQVILNSSQQISSTVATYDIVNYEISNNQYDLNLALKNPTLGPFAVKLPPTATNLANLFVSGDVVEITFYYVNAADSESLYYSRNGVQTTQKKFSTITKLAVSSGFTTPKSILQGTITVSNFNQPASNTNYNTSYNYIAPKQGERITINYNSNSLIDTATFAIEKVRPITADVLVKAAIAVPISVTANVLLLSSYTQQSQTVQQNIVNAVTTLLNATSLGTQIYQSNVSSAIQGVTGVAGLDIINFSTSNGGNQESITAQENEYLQASTVTINIVTSL